MLEKLPDALPELSILPVHEHKNRGQRRIFNVRQPKNL